MKRGYLLAFSALVLIVLLSVSLVAAQDEPSPSADNTGIGGDVASAIDEFTSFISPVASAILGETLTGQYLFAKVLFLLIIFAIIWTALSRVDFFNENTWVLVIISVAASILSTRWLASEDLINTIILPYSALGIAISAGLPFVLYFLLVNVGFKDKPAVVRRVAWIFFAVIFIGLWITSKASMGDAKWIYPITALLAFIMATMDGTIHRFFVKLETDKLGKASSVDAITELKKKLVDLPTLVSSNIITQAEADKRKREYQKKISYLSK